MRGECRITAPTYPSIDPIIIYGTNGIPHPRNEGGVQDHSSDLSINQQNYYSLVGYIPIVDHYDSIEILRL